VPKIVDHNMNEIMPDKNTDDTWLGIERLSGVVI